MDRFAIRALCGALLCALPGLASAGAAACLKALDAGDQRRAEREERTLAPGDHAPAALLCRARLHLFPDPAKDFPEADAGPMRDRAELPLALLGLKAGRPADLTLHAAMSAVSYQRLQDAERAQSALDTARRRLAAGGDARLRREAEAYLLAHRLEASDDPEREEAAVAEFGRGFVEGHYLRVALDHLLAGAYARAGRAEEAGAALLRAHEGLGKGLAGTALARVLRVDLFDNHLLRGDVAGARRLAERFAAEDALPPWQLHVLRGRVHQREEGWAAAAAEILQAYDALPERAPAWDREALLLQVLVSAQALRDRQAFAGAEDLFERVRERAQLRELEAVLDAHVEGLSLLALEWRASDAAAGRRLAGEIGDLARDAGNATRRAWAGWVAAGFGTAAEPSAAERRLAARRFALLGAADRAYVIERGLPRIREGWTRSALQAADRQCLAQVRTGDFLKRYVQTYAPAAKQDESRFGRYAGFFVPFCDCKIEAVASALSYGEWHLMDAARREAARERADRQCETVFIEAADTLKAREF